MRHLLIAALILAPARAEQLRIAVYDQAHLPEDVTGTAFQSLRHIFHDAGIEIEFSTGDLASAEASLLTSPGTPRKGSEREAACRARRDIALEIVAATPSARKSSLLGMAEPLAREGLNARVFDDRIRDAASRDNRNYAAMLAHAMAHEIGHVLLRTTSHSPRGLMSAAWGEPEYGWMARGQMFFTRSQARTMRASLNGEDCAAPAEVSAGFLMPARDGRPAARGKLR